MLEYFARIELSYDEAANEIVIPSFRQDLEGFADIAEEVARFYGYDKIPTTLPSGEATTGKISFKERDRAEGEGHRGILRIFAGNVLFL